MAISALEGSHLSESVVESVPILAVSGGIDSMVMMWQYRNVPGVIVAHFNHGTRPSADEDERFVKRMADRYGFLFVSSKAELGENASEADARRERYDFLEAVAAMYGGGVYVAHHLDDAVESIAINLLRGTGWRGVAVMGNKKIHRPLLEVSKNQIIQIASDEGLVFRQDPTNTENKYLRNRVREVVKQLSDETKRQLGELRERQLAIADEIEQILLDILPTDGRYQREWFVQMDNDVALEILRLALDKTGVSATRPQILDFLKAIRQYEPEKSFNLPGGKLVKMHKTYFVL